MCKGGDGVLCFSGVSVDYGAGEDAVHALADTSLCVERGTVLALIGTSGCGKSTLLRVGAGLIRPTAGTVTSEGAPIDPCTLRIGFLPQNYGLLAWKTVHENILLGVQIKGEWNAQRMDTFDEIVSDLGLTELLTRYPRELSGGQQQRVGLARVFLLAPDLLLMDEPFSALDAHLKSELEQDLLALFESFEGSILYVSHDIDEAFRFCDRIAVVEEGHIREIAPKRDIVSDPQTLATIRLSGCKNTTEAQKAGDHEVFLPSFGVTVRCAQNVPDDVRFFGVRAFRIRRARHEGRNVFRVRVDRASDSRFERTVMVSFLDGAPISSGAADESERFAQTHLQWKVDKLATCEADVPCKGDELLIEIPEEFVYVVTR